MTAESHEVERFECCMTCGSVLLPEDEGACDCDFRGNEKARVDIVLVSDYEKLKEEREEWRGKAEHRLHEWRLRVDDAKAAGDKADEAEAAREMWRERANQAKAQALAEVHGRRHWRDVDPSRELAAKEENSKPSPNLSKDLEVSDG